MALNIIHSRSARASRVLHAIISKWSTREVSLGSTHDTSVQTVVLGITGCIAAYKACELTRALMREGIRVKAVMTEAATHFVGPLTLRTLTDQPVAVSLWDDPGSSPVHHISLAEEADVFVIAPATANVIAKLAQGRADDILTTTALATEATLVIAPAMNTHMWRAEATRANLQTLRDRGAVIVEPESGELACGDVGEGRLAPLEDIMDAVRYELSRSLDLSDRHVLVTAGPTYEPIDPVRFIGNASSGKTGYAIAEECARRGARVTLVSGPTALSDPFEVDTVRVTTALEMQAAVRRAFGDADAVIATAAVSDFRPEVFSSDKVKKGEAPDSVRLVRNPDILEGLGEDKIDTVLIGFAAETQDVEQYARLKLESKNLDLVVANDVSVPGLGFGGDMNKVILVDRHGTRELPTASKRVIARSIADELSRLLCERDIRL